MERQINHKMKTTSIGLIPEDWDAKALSQIGVFSKGKGVTRANSQSGDIPCVRYGEIYTSHNNYIRAFHSHISQEIAATATRLKDGDILFAGSGETKEEIGKAVAFLGVEEAYAGGDIIILSPNEGASSKYLGYVLNAAAAVSQKASMGQGDAVVHIHTKELGDVVIPFPKLEEQEKIADALSGVDDMIEVLDEAIAKKRQIKEGLMQQLLTGKTRLPGFSGEWLTVSLGSISQMYQPQTITQDCLTISGYPVYGANGIIGKYPYYNHTTDQVMVTCRGSSCGTVNYSVGNCWITGNAMVVNMDGYHVNKRFIFYVLDRSDLSSLITGSGQPQIVRTPLQRFEVFIPKSIEEQTAIAESLDSIEADIISIESKREKYALIKQGMMQELLTGKTRLV